MPRLILFFLAFVPLVSAAHAMNWEGHDEWFHEDFLFRDFIEGVPPPLKTPLPTCSARTLQHARNPYEQVAVPGRNCRIDVPAH